MRKFLFFSDGDYKGVEAWLNRLGSQGWELASTGLFTGEFVPTRRQELTYAVERVHRKEDGEARAACLRQWEEAGWEPVGYINGMRIYRSLPCRCPDRAYPPQEEARRNRRITLNRVGWTLIPVLLLLIYAGVLLSLAGGTAWARLGELFFGQWYESWLSGLCVLGLPLVGLGVAAWAVDRAVWAAKACRRLKRRGELPAPPRWLMCLHSGGGLLLALFAVLLLAACGLDALASSGGVFKVCVFLGAMLVGLGVAYWSGNSHTAAQKKGITLAAAAILGGILLLIALDLWGPWQYYQASMLNTAAVASEGWRQRAAAEPVLQKETLGLDMDLYVAEYAHGASLAASWWRGEEWSMDAGDLESRYYRCLTAGIARRVAEDLLAEAEGGIWAGERLSLQGGNVMEERELPGYDQCWYGVHEENGRTVSTLLLRRGRTAALVTAPVDLLAEPYLSALEKQLFD